MVPSRNSHVLDRHPTVSEPNLECGVVECRRSTGQGLVLVISGNGKASLEHGLRSQTHDDPVKVVDVFLGSVGDLDHSALDRGKSLGKVVCRLGYLSVSVFTSLSPAVGRSLFLVQGNNGLDSTRDAYRSLALALWLRSGARENSRAGLADIVRSGKRRNRAVVCPRRSESHGPAPPLRCAPSS